MATNKIEIRSFASSLRAGSEEQSRHIEGYAIVFNSRSQLLGGYFYEEILPEACTQEFIDSQDVRILYNHNGSGISLARSKQGKGTLTLTVDSKGVKMSFDAPDTPFGNEILDMVRRGDADAMSFAFMADHDEWQELEDGTYLRTIHNIALITEASILDVSPAYVDTSVAVRSLIANFKDNIDMSKRNKRTEEELEEEKKSKRADEETQEEEKKSKREDDEKEEDREDDEKEEQEEKSSKRSDEDPDEDEEREDEDEDREDDEEEDDERSLKSYYRELEKTLDF